MVKEKILIVEDEKNIAKLIRYNLEKAEYNCYSVQSGEDAIPILKKHSIDLILLDIMLPGIDGFEVCRRIKQEESLKNIPIVILTAKGEEVDRIVGLELGADDYIVKPFSPRELILRIKAILKRGKAETAKKDIITIGDLSVNISKHKVTVKNRDIELTRMEFKLLVTLMERRGRLQDRDKLLNDVWNIDSMISTRTIDTHIKKLREKLGRAGGMIETVRGMGYRFKEDDED
jgi:two-component system phosphate regulon response regulator PhoB